MASSKPHKDVFDTIRRFSSKVDLYEKYRWSYSKEALETLFQKAILTKNSVIADIASGPGTLSQYFVDKVHTVLAIEPSPGMRECANRRLGPHDNFKLIDGLSHHTTLEQHSVDLIIIGRAMHWFEPISTRQEFQRILKPGGWLAVLQIPCLDQALVTAINSLRTEQYGWHVQGDKSNQPKTPLDFYFGVQGYQVNQFYKTQTETYLDFLGRLSSLSPAPNYDHPLRSRFEQGVLEVFNSFQSNGHLTINTATELVLGKIN